MPQIAQRVQQFGTTVFTEINQLAAQYDTVDLGQGKPDYPTPVYVVEAVAEALQSGRYNQYPPGFGTSVMREAVANHAQHFYNMTVDPQSEVLITSGATGGLFASILGHINPGDEVIVIEPFFDVYVPNILVAGGVPVYVPMHPPSWELNSDELRAAFSDKTRAIIINSPNNPTGRVYSRDELQLIADLCIEYDAICISDEVYEHMTYDGILHTPIATLDGMWERTLTISSIAKTFAATGWKVGWVIAPQPLLTGAWRAHQLMTFAIHHPTQIGAAKVMNDTPDFDDLAAMYHDKRALLMQGLDAAGLPYFKPEGAFYIMADFSGVFEGDDLAFVKHLITDIGVTSIPPASFFSDAHKHMAKNYVRFAFCKKDDTLTAANERLLKLR